MEYIRLGNFEVWPDQLNWTVPGKKEDYIGNPQVYRNLLDESIFEELIESRIGKGWRLPYLNEMSYIEEVSLFLKISKSQKFYIPLSYNYIIQETISTVENSHDYRTFFTPENNGGNLQPWVPGFFLFGPGKRTFKIQPVRDV